MKRIPVATFLLGALAGAAVALAFTLGPGAGRGAPRPFRGPGREAEPAPEARAPGEGAATAAPESPGYWLAALTLHACRGEQEKARECAASALRLGADPGEVLERLGLLSPRARVAAVRDLGPALQAEAAALAKFLFDAAATDEGFRAAARALAGVSGELPNEIQRLLRRMVEIDPARAEAALAEAAAAAGWKSETLMSVASVLVEGEAGGIAAGWIRRALLEAGDEAPVGLVTLLSRVDLPAAAAEARRLADANPSDAKRWEQLGDLLRSAKDTAGAFDAYRRAALLSPDDEGVVEGLYELDAAAAMPFLEEISRRSRSDECVGMLARALLRDGRTAEAEEIYFRAYRLDLTDVEWLRGMVQLDPARALGTLTEHINGFGGDRLDEVVGARAEALFALGDREKAYEGYLAALELDAEDRDWLRGIAKADPARALETLEPRRGEGVPEVLGALGDAYAALGRRADAIAAYDAAITAEEEPRPWIAALARVDPARSLALLRERIAADPADEDNWGHLGDAYRDLGERAKAIEAYDRALALAPADGIWALRRAALLR